MSDELSKRMRTCYDDEIPSFVRGHWADEVEALEIRIKELETLNRQLEQGVLEIHHYYKDSGADQPCAKRIVAAVEGQFAWFLKKEV